MIWGDALPALLVAAAWLIGPGLVVTAPFRFGLIARVAISGLVSACVVAGATTLFGAFGLPFQWWQVVAVTGIGLALSVAVRPTVPRLETRADRRVLLLIGTWILSVLAAAILMFARVPSPDRIAQTYDNLFHLTATGAIIGGHSASPFALGDLTNTSGAMSFVPSGWHAVSALVVQATGVPVPVAFNILWLASVAVIWLPGVAWFARTILPTWVATVVALPLGVSFGWFPYALVTWGPLYPAVLGHALLPAAAGMTIVAVRAVLGEHGGRTPARRWTAAIVGFALAGGALVAADPRVVASLVVIAIPFALWRLASWSGREVARGPEAAVRARTVLWSCAAAGVVIVAGGLVYGVLSGASPIETGDAHADTIQTLWSGLGQVITTRSLTGVNGIVTIVAPPLALAVLGGIFMAARRPSTRWIIVAHVVLAVLYALAAAAIGPLSGAVTALWHNDPYRVAAALPVTALPLAAIGIISLGRLIVPARRALGAAAAVVVAILVAVTSTGTLAATGVTESAGAVFRQPVQSSDGAVLTSAEMTFMRNQVRSIVPDDQRVLGDPWDGSALTGLLADREAVFPHVAGEWDAKRRVLASVLQTVGDNPAVCAALDDLRVRYVMYSSTDAPASGAVGDDFSGIHSAVEAGLFPRVATDGESALYRIDQCGELD